MTLLLNKFNIDIGLVKKNSLCTLYIDGCLQFIYMTLSKYIYVKYIKMRKNFYSYLLFAKKFFLCINLYVLMFYVLIYG